MGAGANPEIMVANESHEPLKDVLSGRITKIKSLVDAQMRGLLPGVFLRADIKRMEKANRGGRNPATRNLDLAGRGRAELVRVDLIQIDLVRADLVQADLVQVAPVRGERVRGNLNIPNFDRVNRKAKNQNALSVLAIIVINLVKMRLTNLAIAVKNRMVSRLRDQNSIVENRAREEEPPASIGPVRQTTGILHLNVTVQKDQAQAALGRSGQDQENSIPKSVPLAGRSRKLSQKPIPGHLHASLLPSP